MTLAPGALMPFATFLILLSSTSTSTPFFAELLVPSQTLTFVINTCTGFFSSFACSAAWAGSKKCIPAEKAVVADDRPISPVNDAIATARRLRLTTDLKDMDDLLSNCFICRFSFGHDT